MKNVTKLSIVLLASIFTLLTSCHVTVPYHPSTLNGVTKGMPYKEVVKTVKNDFEDSSLGDDPSYINVLGKKHKIIKYYFTNIYNSDGQGNTTVVKDAYFLVFGDDDKLIAMGYPYEFIRSEDDYTFKIGLALREEITEYDDE